MAVITLLTLRQASEAVGLSETTVRRLVQKEDFAPCIDLTPGRLMFRESDINAWINSKQVPAKEAGL